MLGSSSQARARQRLPENHILASTKMLLSLHVRPLKMCLRPYDEKRLPMIERLQQITEKLPARRRHRSPTPLQDASFLSCFNRRGSEGSAGSPSRTRESSRPLDGGRWPHPLASTLTPRGAAARKGLAIVGIQDGLGTRAAPRRSPGFGALSACGSRSGSGPGSGEVEARPDPKHLCEGLRSTSQHSAALRSTARGFASTPQSPRSTALLCSRCLLEEL